MELEIIIIGIVVIFIFVGFEMSSIKEYKRTIASQKEIIQKQDSLIEDLQKDYNILISKQFENIKNKINGK